MFRAVDVDSSDRQVPTPASKQQENYEPPDHHLDGWVWDDEYSSEKREAPTYRGRSLTKVAGGSALLTFQLLKEAEIGSTYLLKCLLRDGFTSAAIDALVDDLGRNYLHVAATHGQNLAIATAVKSGLNINLASVNGSTPLMLACAWDMETAAALLLDLGADATTQDLLGQTALTKSSERARGILVRHEEQQKARAVAISNDVESMLHRLF